MASIAHPEMMETFLSRAVMDTFKGDLRKKLREVGEEVVNEVVNSLASEIEIKAANYRNRMNFEDVVRVVVEDKRNAKET